MPISVLAPGHSRVALAARARKAEAAAAAAAAAAKTLSSRPIVGVHFLVTSIDVSSGKS